MVITINKTDYLNWAKEYKEQADIIEQKIQEKQKIKRFKTSKERAHHEKSLLNLYNMRNDCLYSMSRLIKQAESMEDGNEEEK